MSTPGTIEEFVAERNAAFLSMDENRIRSNYRKWNQREMPDDPDVFWGSVHKAITAIRSFPIEVRRKSKDWLDARGMSSWDDGEL